MVSHGNYQNDLVKQRDLPHDLITQNILTRLPIKSVLRFKSISKQWYSALSSPHFAQTHFKMSQTSLTESLLIRSDDKYQFLSYENGEMNLVNIEVEFDREAVDLVLVGSCNGLVCFGSTSGCLFIVWNPITHEFRKYIDDSDICDFSTKACMVVWGFGYVSAVDDYKIVRICKKWFNLPIRVHVFSMRSNKWRRIDEDSYHNLSGLRLAERLNRPGVLVKEALYWMDDLPFKFDRSDKKILYFDLALELIDTFPHLDVSTPSEWFRGGDDCFDQFLCVVKGCLSKYGRGPGGRGGVITILKQPGAIEQISISMDIVDAGCRNLIGFVGSDVFFTHYFSSRTGETHLGIIDQTTWPMKHIPLITFERALKTEIVNYAASLISIAAVTRTPTFRDIVRL